jgi:hypothetical protein
MPTTGREVVKKGVFAVAVMLTVEFAPAVVQAGDGYAESGKTVPVSGLSTPYQFNNSLVPANTSPLRFASSGLFEKRDLLVQADTSKGQVQKLERADALFENIEAGEKSSIKVKGFYQVEAAYTMPSPSHGSKFLNRLDVSAQGAFTESVKWKVGGRVNYDAIFDLNNFYSNQVRDDQRFEGVLGENYLDISAGNLEFRLGRQHIIWGEVVGLFFADVVSARDLREFILPDFDLLRIPQWAARAEYFKDDFHAEVIWIPVPSFDKIGKPGAEFYPFPPAPPPGFGFVINDEQRPARNSSNQNYGLRLSYLKNGWDVAGFAYRSVDPSPTFFREVVTAPIPALIYTPRHDKITQYGSTLAKDLGNAVLKGEAVYTQGRNFNVTRLNDDDGLVRQNYLDYIVSLEFPWPEEGRLNFQLFQRRFMNHDADIIPDKHESGASLYLTGKWGNRAEPQLLIIHSLNRNDWMVRPKVVWTLEKNWRLVTGADFFGGPATGFFGQFDNKDRVYVEARRSF